MSQPPDPLLAAIAARTAAIEESLDGLAGAVAQDLATNSDFIAALANAVADRLASIRRRNGRR